MVDSRLLFAFDPSVLQRGVMILVGVLLLTSCSLFDEAETAESEGVRARVVGQAIVVDNQRMEPVWIRTIGSSVYVAALFAPTSLEGAPIRPGEQRVVPFDDIRLSESESSVTIFWWEAVEVDGEREAGPSTAFRVEL